MVYKESVAKCVSKEELALLNDDKLFFTLIQKEFERGLSDRLVDILKSNSEVVVKQSDICVFDMDFLNSAEYKQQLEWAPLTRCKDCKHRPRLMEGCSDSSDGFSLDFPDYKCPCRCEDPYYSRMPDDNWFCGNGEKRDE